MFNKRIVSKAYVFVLILVSMAVSVFGEGQFPIGYGAAFKSQRVTCGGVAKQSIFIQPPYQSASGKTLGTYKLQLPSDANLQLTGFVGLEDKTLSNTGVALEVYIGEKHLFERKVANADGWKAIQVDLSAYKGKEINLVLAVDSLGDPMGDLGAIAEPRVMSGDKVVLDLIALDKDAVKEVRLREQKAKPQHGQAGQNILMLVNQLAYDLAGPKSFLVQVNPNSKPPLPRAVKATSRFPIADSKSISRIIDGDVSSKAFWGVRGWKSGDYIAIDLGKVKQVSRVEIRQSQGTGDYCHQGKVQFSVDGKHWDDIAAVSSPLIDKTFSAKSMRYVRLMATADQTQGEQLFEFTAYAQEDQGQIDQWYKQWRTSVEQTDAKPFKVKSIEDGTVVYKGKLEFAGNIKDSKASRKWGNTIYFSGDFTKLKKAGSYLIEAQMPEKTISPSFTVGDNAVVKKLMPLCGVSSFNGRRWKYGGWKSDAPYGGHPLIYCNGPGLYGLARAAEVDSKFWGDDVTADALKDEARWGMKIIDHHHNIAKLAHDDVNKHTTLPKVPDGSLSPDPQWAGMGIAPLAVLARAEYLSKEERSHCLKLAKRSWEFYRKHEFTEPGYGPVSYWYCNDEGDTLRSFRHVIHGLLLLADLEMHVTEADDRYLENARINAAAIVKHWEIENKEDAQTWRMRIWQEGIAPGALGTYVLRHPNAASKEVKQKLKKWAAYVTGDKAGMNSNPFGIYKWDEQHFFNPYQNGHSWKSRLGTHDWWQGEDGRYLTNAWAAFTASKALDNPRLRTLGCNFINYICGVNPLGNTMITKVGQRPAQRIEPGPPNKVVYLNGPADVPSGGKGLCCLAIGRPWWALVDSGTPAAGESWGPKNNWKLHEDHPGYIVIAAGPSGLALVVRNVTCTRCTGKLVGAMADTDSTHTVDNIEAICGLTPVDAASDTLTVDNVHDWDADDNADCRFGWNESTRHWELYQVTCPT